MCFRQSSHVLLKHLKVAAIPITFNAVDAEAASPYRLIGNFVCVTSTKTLRANPITVNIVPRYDALGDVVEVESVYT